MDILSVDVLPPPGEHDGDDEGGEDHALLRLHVSSSDLQGGSDDATAYDASQPPEGPSSASSPLSRRAGARRRRKVSKGLQLILLRKYVQCAKQFGRVPDRAATEQLLEQGYDEFYYQGGSLSEPRMSYAAFLKLVRNRRSEVVRQTRGGAPIAQRGGTRRYQKEQIEIQAFIDELESVRHGQTRGTLEYDALGAGTTGEHMHAVTTDPSVPTMLSDSSSIMGDAGTDGGVSAGDLSTAETYSSVMAGAPGDGNDDVVVSRSKLDLMLRVAQETLVAQKRILEEASSARVRVLFSRRLHQGRTNDHTRPGSSRMAELIDKIGRFFAEQEAQIQQSFTQVAQAPARVPPPLSRPPPPVHKVPTQPYAHPPDFRQETPASNSAQRPPRSYPLVRRRLSFKPVAPPPLFHQSSEEGIDQLLDELQRQSEAHEVSLSTPAMPMRPAKLALPREDIWSHRLSGDVVSWASSPSSASTETNTSLDIKDDSTPERQRKPRPPQQKHRKRLRKKKSGASKRSGNQEDDQPDPIQLAKEHAEKVEAALVLAQERAKRIQQGKLQLDRERELERQEAALRLQEQMLKIEAVRARSFRQSSASTMTTARSSLSNGEPSHDTESVWTADTNDMMGHHKPPSDFMIELEARLRDKMSLEMHVKQSCIEKHKQRERVRLKLDKLLQQNMTQRSKVARLEAMKASLETELAAVLEDAAQTRQQRRELELADEKERLRRQREAERELQIRLREEEWSEMMEDEKARSQVAAEARVKASKRVEARSAKLRRMMQSHRYQPRRSLSGLSSTATTSNNDDEHSDGYEETTPTSRHSIDELQNKPLQPFKMNLFLPPELADFEEDGLCNTIEQLQAATEDDCESKPLQNNNDDKLEGCSISTKEGDATFSWQVSSFPDHTKFMEVLRDMVSEDEDE
ncbi:hypothetical protein PF008_g7746 [Phytophthora fragariae]|uniref:Uncharacterized protein n=1 Tax=Phytophthora fragariae TaxID=53985 RepID=A0A6G0S1U1_9STRA|nr:hypothetical protein PF008_g7746 [Phytophthora fragariae]